MDADRRVQLDGAGQREREEPRVAVDVTGDHPRPGRCGRHPDDLIADDRRAARRRRRPPIVGAVEAALARADPDRGAIVVERQPADRRTPQPVDDCPAVSVVAEEAAGATRPDAPALHRPPRRQRDDVAGRAGRGVPQLPRLVGDPASGLVGAGDPGAPFVVDGDGRERARPLGVAVAHHFILAAGDVPASQPRRAGRPEVRRLGRQRRDGPGLGALDDGEVAGRRRGGPATDAGVAGRERQRRAHPTPPETARPHVRRYYATPPPVRIAPGTARVRAARRTRSR